LKNEFVEVFVNVIVVDDGVTELSQAAVFDSPLDPVAELNTGIANRIQNGVLANASRVFASCGVVFRLATAKAVRPHLIYSVLSPETSLNDAFSSTEAGLTLDLGGINQTVDVFAATAIHLLGTPDQLALFREGPHLTVFLTGATLTQGEFSSLAVGQVQGRFSIVSIQQLEQLDETSRAETFAHEWGHNLGLLHSDQDGLPETDFDQSNLMLPYRSEQGNHRLSPEQCARVKSSPLLVPGASNIEGELRVPQTYATIQTAVAAAAPGATILVGEGVYANPVFIDKPLHLKAQAGTRPRLWRNHDGLPSLLIDGASGIEVKGLDVTGAGIIALNSIGVSVRGNKISNNTQHGLYFKNVQEATISGNDIWNNASKGVFLIRVNNGRVSQNIISDHDGQFGAGIEMIGCHNIQIEKNTVSGNMEGIVIMQDNEHLAIVDNQIVENLDYGLSLFFFATSDQVIDECEGNNVSGNRVDLSENMPPACAAGNPE
jgi:parallel beta-helix repeat protein